MYKVIISFLILFTLFPLATQLQNINLPQGFTITYFSNAVPDARSLARGDNGTIFAETHGNRVYALVDSNNDYTADRVITLLTGLNTIL